MKLLLDMNLPPSLTVNLRSAGCTAVHWSAIGDPRAADTTVLAPESYAPLLIAALTETADTLTDGALVTVSPGESRVRILPLRRS